MLVKAQNELMGHYTVKQHLEEAQQVLEQFLSDEEQLAAVERAGALMAEAVQNGRHLFSCGNGGSLCDAMHFAEELTGRFRESRQPIAATAIADPSHLTCVSNDFGYDEVFSRYVQAWGNAGDVLLTISTSGNSPNVLKAAEMAKKQGVKVVALTGKGGGRLAEVADVEVRAPQTKFSDRAQEIHIKVIHILIDLIEQGTRQE